MTCTIRHLPNGVSQFTCYGNAEERWIEAVCKAQAAECERAIEEARLVDDVLDSLGAADCIDDDLITQVGGCKRDWDYDLDQHPARDTRL